MVLPPLPSPPTNQPARSMMEWGLQVHWTLIENMGCRCKRILLEKVSIHPVCPVVESELQLISHDALQVPFKGNAGSKSPSMLATRAPQRRQQEFLTAGSIIPSMPTKARVPQCRQQESLNAGSKSSSVPTARVPQCRQQESLNAGSKSPSVPTARVPQCRQQEFLNAEKVA